jgi:hypothetical protein
MLRITFANGRANYEPGDTVAGDIGWELSEDLDKLELRLFWHTEGRGTTDTGIVATAWVENPGRRGEEHFQFTLPGGPYSYSGRLVSIVWGVELIAKKDAAFAPFTMGPGGRETTPPQEVPPPDDGQRLDDEIEAEDFDS